MHLERERGQDVWRIEIWPALCEIMEQVLRSAQLGVQHRDRSFSLYGYDFMLDRDCRPWLIEVNASPCIEHSTPITTRLCSPLIAALLELTLEHQPSDHKVGDSIGRWRCRYSEELSAPRLHTADTTALKVQGVSVRRRSAPATMQGSFALKSRLPTTGNARAWRAQSARHIRVTPVSGHPGVPVSGYDGIATGLSAQRSSHTMDPKVQANNALSKTIDPSTLQHGLTQQHTARSNVKHRRRKPKKGLPSLVITACGPPPGYESSSRSLMPGSRAASMALAMRASGVF